MTAVILDGIVLGPRVRAARRRHDPRLRPRWCSQPGVRADRGARGDRRLDRDGRRSGDAPRRSSRRAGSRRRRRPPRSHVDAAGLPRTRRGADAAGAPAHPRSRLRHRRRTHVALPGRRAVHRHHGRSDLDPRRADDEGKHLGLGDGAGRRGLAPPVLRRHYLRTRRPLGDPGRGGGAARRASTRRSSGPSSSRSAARWRGSWRSPPQWWGR